MKLFNTSTAAYSVTILGTVVRFPPKSWSQELTAEALGTAMVQRLLRKKILVQSPLSQLPG